MKRWSANIGANIARNRRKTKDAREAKKTVFKSARSLFLGALRR